MEKDAKTKIKPVTIDQKTKSTKDESIKEALKDYLLSIKNDARKDKLQVTKNSELEMEIVDSKTKIEPVTIDQKTKSTKDESAKIALKDYMLSIKNDARIKSSKEKLQVTKDLELEREIEVKTKKEPKRIDQSEPFAKWLE